MAKFYRTGKVYMPTSKTGTPYYISSSRYGGETGVEMVGAPSGRFIRPVLHAVTRLAQSWGRVIFTSAGILKPAELFAKFTLLTISRRNRLVVVEFLPGSKATISRKLANLAHQFLAARSCIFIETMTTCECWQVRHRYRLNQKKHSYIPFYHLDHGFTGCESGTGYTKRCGLLASGLNPCDWGLLLSGEEGQNCNLTIVCSRSEAMLIAKPGTPNGVVLIEATSKATHDVLLSRCSVHVLLIVDRGVGSVPVRLRDSLSQGAATIVAEVAGISGCSDLASARCLPGDLGGQRDKRDLAVSIPTVVAERMQECLEIGKTNTRTIHVEQVVRSIKDLDQRCSGYDMTLEPKQYDFVNLSFTGKSGLADYAVALSSASSVCAKVCLVTSVSLDPQFDSGKFDIERLFRRSRHYAIDVVRYVRWVLRGRPTWVVVHGPLKFTIFDALAIRLLRWRGVRMCIVIHDVLPHRVRTFSRFARKVYYNSFDAGVAHSVRAVEDSRVLGVRISLTMLPHGSYELFRVRSPTVEDARERLMIAPEARVILFFGPIEERKSVVAFFEAA